MMLLARFFVLAGFLSAAFSQSPVSLRNTYERIWCVVPMVGSGTYADPRRPMFAPAPRQRGQQLSREGILGFTYELSDDGRFALAEFVASDRSAFSEILASPLVKGKAFVKGKATREEVETEFRKYKKDFDAGRLGVIAP